jgi:hypothetical protein
MSDRFWEEFVLTDTDDEILRLDEAGEVYDTNDGEQMGGDTRYRFRDHAEATAASDWLFLQDISGVWHWWTWAVEEEGYHPLPQAQNLGEAKALAVVEWRMS